ncbi:MAG: DUF5916 domain-containing protein, partial [Balneolaceae bacterium]
MSYQVEAHRISPDHDFQLDGRLDEPFWQNITPNTNFTQQEPEEGSEPSERSEIYIAYDDHYLYIGAILFDSEPDKILAWQKRRDESLFSDDRFMWTLDTFNDGRNAYFFETNPAAIRGDGLLTTGQGRTLNKSWDGIWNVRTSITDKGWIAEIRIPFRTLDFDPNQSVWRINFQRTIRRHNEEILWAGWRRNQGLFQPQNAGRLTGLTGMNQGLGLEVTPYATTGVNRTWTEGEPADDGSANAGFDVSYNITPSIRTSMTVNTDFAETEVDQRRVNLTRFPLFFPEQRSFFLEGSNIFSFAPASRVTPFFSRRIGLVEGDPIPIHAGAKVLGREGDASLGFYQIRTGPSGEVNPEDFTVARVKQNILEESSIGMIYTRRATLDDDLLNNRHTLGADLELNTSSFLGDKNLQFQAFFVWHNMHTPDENTSFWDRTSRGIRLEYPNYPFYGQLSYREFGKAFNPAVGFAQRVAFRRLQPTIGYEHFFNNHTWLRSIDTQLRFEYLTDLDFKPETVELRLTPFELTFESGDQIKMEISRNFERLTFDFDLLRDGSIIIPSGDYYTWSFTSELQSASYRPVSAGAVFTHESFWTGTRTVYALDLTVRPSPGINLSADWEQSNGSLPQGSFQTDLFRLSNNIDLTPDIAFTNIVQFDNVSEVLGLYNRFRWTIQPGADLYLVHTFNWIQLENQFDPIETQGVIKLNYTHRF